MKAYQGCVKTSSHWVVHATYTSSQCPTSVGKAFGNITPLQRALRQYCLKLAGATCLLLLAVLTIKTVDHQHLHIYRESSCQHHSGNHELSSLGVRWFRIASRLCHVQPVLLDIPSPLLHILDSSREGCSSSGSLDGSHSLDPHTQGSPNATSLPWKQLELPDPVVASRCAWKALGVAEAARSSMQGGVHDHRTPLQTSQQQQASAGNKQGEMKQPPGLSMDSAERILSGLEAFSLLDLFFSHMLSREEGRAARPHELQQPEVQPLLNLLRHIWLAHPLDSSRRSSREGHVLPSGSSSQNSGSTVHPDHCSTDSGTALITAVAQASEVLSLASCKGPIHSSTADSPSVPTLLPYVLVRRLTLAVLQLVYASDRLHSTACQSAVDGVSHDSTGKTPATLVTTEIVTHTIPYPLAVSDSWGEDLPYHVCIPAVLGNRHPALMSGRTYGQFLLLAHR
jgi:hypothetical protein